MKKLLLLAFSLGCLLLTKGQENGYKKIVFPYPVTIAIRQDTIIEGEHLYDIDFYNQQGELIKAVKRYADENHSVAKGYVIQNRIQYFFYSNGKKTEEFTINPLSSQMFKTTYTYLSNGASSGWSGYRVSSRLNKGILMKNIKADIYLNNPSMFPKKGLRIFSKQERRYQDDKLIYECYYEADAREKALSKVKERNFIYDKEGRLGEIVIKPLSIVGGTSHWQTKYEYDSIGKLIRSINYQDKKLFATHEYSYTDSQLIENGKYYVMHSNKPDADKFFVAKVVYKLKSDGNYYDENNKKWQLFEGMGQ